ncbi:hypothetical protein CQ018_14965 [Arthrobacter sp. MYb227]|uniref:polysialyltransferase family glycosyltransferase n=1 Tax=Arthrobacter sp. MYb227 TaxID=1848601 RepID=UPI000CFB16A7|nr:polysialyltransferase family glycosyltransferase [Arthrobacter sp. MYb227]PQZ90289.1 hypothetical protein CQ018_14965 [Arthrobacter sp. MYb227]
MIQLIAASTAYQVASLVAMIDSGALPATRGERVLVLADGSQIPEITTPITQSPGFAQLSTRFDRVVDLGELLWPRRPQQFSPRTEELPMWETLLRSHWGLGSQPIELVVESIQVNPAIALCRIFHDAPIFIHADGLMSYGPTRNRIDQAILQRLESLIYPDLIPGLKPLLLHEAAPDLSPMNPAHLATVFRSLANSCVDEQLARIGGSSSSCALILGQYLGGLGLLDEAQELELHRQMLVEAKKIGAQLILFKPHPAASATSALRLLEHAAELGINLEIYAGDLGAEIVALKLKPLMIFSAFSTALATCSQLFDMPVRALGTTNLLKELAPYENSNRIPLSIVDALYARNLRPGEQLQELINAISYAMQPQRLASLRTETQHFLETHPVERARYFKQRRLHSLALPNTLPPRTLSRRLAAQQLPRRLRRVAKRGVQRSLRFLRRQLDRVDS